MGDRVRSRRHPGRAGHRRRAQASGRARASPPSPSVIAPSTAGIPPATPRCSACRTPATSSCRPASWPGASIASWSPHSRWSPASIAQQLDTIPPERKRSIRDLGYHIFRVGLSFVDTMDRGHLARDVVRRARAAGHGRRRRRRPLGRAGPRPHRRLVRGRRRQRIRPHAEHLLRPPGRPRPARAHRLALRPTPPPALRPRRTPRHQAPPPRSRPMRSKACRCPRLSGSDCSSSSSRMSPRAPVTPRPGAGPAARHHGSPVVASWCEQGSASGPPTSELGSDPAPLDGGWLKRAGLEATNGDEASRAGAPPATRPGRGVTGARERRSTGRSRILSASARASCGRCRGLRRRRSGCGRSVRASGGCGCARLRRA